jgi:hypothetical protein
MLLRLVWGLRWREPFPESGEYEKFFVAEVAQEVLTYTVEMRGFGGSPFLQACLCQDSV